MIVGIKYCGGCNERFARRAEVEKHKKELPQHIYCSALEQREFDYILVVCGCSARCAEHRSLHAGRKKFVVHTPEQLTMAFEQLAKS